MPWVSTLSDLSRRRGKSWQSWAVAAAIFLVGLFLRFALGPVLDGIKFLTFYPSIAAATLICGPLQGLTVLLLSTLSAWFFLFEPINSFGISDKTIAPLVGFQLVGSFIILLVAALREAVRRLEIAKTAQETLFSELQHRVANNLQLVVALLRHAQRNLRNPVLAAETLHDAEERIIAMSQLHRRLIDGTAFIYGFQPLLREILSNAFLNLPVKFNVDVQEAPDLSIDHMTAVALLVNEAALNSAKHVFSRGLGTHFDVSLRRDDMGRLKLNIRDDGPGMIAQVSAEGVGSLGMGIMESFATQLGGSLEIASSEGMSLSVSLASLS